ncbi:MAG: bifunctional diguanylate cyclase/phosphodiesterase [Solirubrobacterales bacterium]|nr:bifunctional diguanylate cyclase/phosphodiesterase [Solirubrobacterales bacterium]
MERAALGWALHARGDDVAAEVLRRLGGTPTLEVMASIANADRLATQVVGRWLATGEGATGDEHAQLSGPGALVGAITLDELVKAYLAWREVTIQVLEEEGARLGSDEALLAEGRVMVARSSDVSLVRMARQFEAERGRLAAELASERAKLAHQAMHDPLTGLPNRVLLYDRITQALSATGRYGGITAVLFVDLDGFKEVNDGCGHETGDRILVEVSDRLRSVVRPSDTVARLGGDEFVVLCERLDAHDEASAVADRVLDAVRFPFVAGDRTMALSASIGIAFPADGEQPDALVGRADAAMYVAKRRRDARELAPAA